jgi:hypothetical protein
MFQQVKSTIRAALIGLIALLGAVGANAEQADPRSKPIIPVPPTQPKLIIRTEDLFPLTPQRMGVLTLVQPQTNGEVVRISIPIGELTMKSVRAISDAHRKRIERKVDERIAKELQQITSERGK